MKISVLSAGQVGDELRRLMDTYDIYAWAVAWGSDGPLADYLLSNPQHIGHLVIGTAFYVTDPALLTKLEGVPTARIAGPDGPGLFHPKSYYFQSGVRAAAIVGSSNFTMGGTSSNVEMSVLLEGNADDDPLRSIRERIIEMWNVGQTIDQDFLDSYRRQYEANQAARALLRRPPTQCKPKLNAANPRLLDYDWPTYVARLKERGDARFDERLSVLRHARTLFSSSRLFEEFTLQERRAISGVIGDHMTLPGVDDAVDWGVFGSMKGFGVLQSLVKDNDRQLSNALDQIPTTGPVHQSHYRAYCDAILRAFEGKPRICGVPTVSRFLALKRPDTFVCVDNKNISTISKDLGFAQGKLTIESYWDLVVAPIIESRWWNADRPIGKDGFLWDGRVAMLDSIYYYGLS